ncbi:diguanylate cyclase/phosphodiesterase (GGDEF & EAL domains) with PAS/PAC sensor(s) [Sphingobium indicum BiD32]|uniref:diguanylate cyclase n=1 Tax=Sphingobium indicum BiD32 TaxID=1301087 RepID=N1MVU1_9SPHN|nr:GGDEF domain-containing protein [Sphingobium indicum]CCW19677.1 diguanylate cyclase/phosphodiesterase (GGDEF & EAL domains) with PAS/PAC sensor(s) [Sphingobium indicum BiD32]
MDPAIIIIALLFFTSVIMALAMGVAWLHFGRQRHVLSWALSYSAAMMQWIANAGGIVLKSGPLMALAASCIVVSGTLVVVGVRQRSGQSVPWRLMIAAGSVVAVGGIYAAMIQDRSLQGMIVPGYVGILMLCSAASLWPRERRFNAPEMAFFIMFLMFALFQSSLAISAAADLGRAPGAGLVAYRAILGLGLPSIYVGTGVAAVMVVAGDLAHQLRRQMRHDPLTNVLNRRGLDEAAVRAIANARRYDRPLALVVCDLDGFKALNDGHGHITGDAALRGFAQLLTSAVRRGDIVARMGGDEFGLLLVETNAAAAADVMERVRAEIGCLILPSAPRAHLRASFGVAELQAGDEQLDDLVARADAALYDAKRDGKDRVAIWRNAA